MADREKVIKGLEEAKEFIRTRSNGSASKICRLMDVCNAAVILLKAQEAVEPTLIREGRNKHCNDYVCPRCDEEVVYEQNYCSECGVKFMWEGR